MEGKINLTMIEEYELFSHLFEENSAVAVGEGIWRWHSVVTTAETTSTSI